MTVYEELWVPVEGYPNYEVSNYGRVINVGRNKDIRPSATPKGDFTKVRLSRDGKVKHLYLHRLVAKHFMLDFSNLYRVEQINGNRRDCSVWNLKMSKKKVSEYEIRKRKRKK